MDEPTREDVVDTLDNEDESYLFVINKANIELTFKQISDLIDRLEQERDEIIERRFEDAMNDWNFWKLRKEEDD